MKYSYKFLDVQNFFKKRTTIDKKKYKTLS